MRYPADSIRDAHAARSGVVMLSTLPSAILIRRSHFVKLMVVMRNRDDKLTAFRQFRDQDIVKECAMRRVLVGGKLVKNDDRAALSKSHRKRQPPLCPAESASVENRSSRIETRSERFRSFDPLLQMRKLVLAKAIGPREQVETAKHR